MSWRTSEKGAAGGAGAEETGAPPTPACIAGAVTCGEPPKYLRGGGGGKRMMCGEGKASGRVFVATVVVAAVSSEGEPSS